MTTASDRQVIIHRKTRVFDGRYKIDETLVSHERLGGPGLVENVTRLVFERGDSAAGLVHDRERDVVALVEQFRLPTYEKSNGWTLELVAGEIDEGDTGESCIRREALEELGYRVSGIEPIARVFVSPGASSERVFLYYLPVVPADLVNAAAAGRAEEGEDLRRVELPTAEFLRRCAAGEIDDAKTLLAGLWLQARLAR